MRVGDAPDDRQAESAARPGAASSGWRRGGSVRTRVRDRSTGMPGPVSLTEAPRGRPRRRPPRRCGRPRRVTQRVVEQVREQHREARGIAAHRRRRACARARGRCAFLGQRRARDDRVVRERGEVHGAKLREAPRARAAPSSAAARPGATRERRRLEFGEAAARAGASGARSASSTCSFSAASGVRSSCAASAVKRRCAASASSRRASSALRLPPAAAVPAAGPFRQRRHRVGPPLGDRARHRIERPQAAADRIPDQHAEQRDQRGERQQRAQRRLRGDLAALVERMRDLQRVVAGDVRVDAPLAAVVRDVRIASVAGTGRPAPGCDQ